MPPFLLPLLAVVPAHASGTLIAGLTAADGVPCVVTSEDWAIDCSDVDRSERCTVRHRQVVDGACAWAGATWNLSEPPRLDGVPMRYAPAEGGVWTAGDAAATGAAPGAFVPSGLRLRVPDGRHVLERTLQVIVSAASDGSRVPADEARHLVLHHGLTARSWWLEIRPSEGAVPDVAVSVTARGPSGATWLGPATSVSGESGARLTRAGAEARSPFTLGWRAAGRPVHVGGPMVGVGAALGPDGVTARGRVELELGVADHLLPGLSWDFGAGAQTLTPRVELATAASFDMCSFCFFRMGPSLSVGVGAPFTIATGDVGLRGLVGAQWGPIGLVLAADLWRDRPVEPSLMLRGGI